MPYRIDLPCPRADALEVLVELGALDIEPVSGGLAAIIPDPVSQDTVARALGVGSVTVSVATARDNGSVWLLNPRPVRIGSLLIAPPEVAASPKTLRLMDSDAFGTGHHPTTALCIEALEEILAIEALNRVLDVGTGSGILALAALMLGVKQAIGLEIDSGALAVAAENARLNNLTESLRLFYGGPDVVNGNWPLVVANVLAAPLIEMAPALIRRLGSRGRIILSGIPSSVEPEVRQTYQNLGIRHMSSKTRSGWTVLIGQTSW